MKKILTLLSSLGVMLSCFGQGPVSHQASILAPGTNTAMPAVTAGSTISGTVMYDNPAQTPLNASTVILRDNAGATAAETITDMDGNYSFADVPDGIYTLEATTPKNWGGGNSADALLMLRHSLGMVTLTGMRLLAADIDGDNSVTSADALLVLKRYLNMVTSFTTGDWLFDPPVLHIDSAGAYVVNIKGLCFGDVNGSFPPPFAAACPGLSSFIFDGQTYHTVQIGGQCWMQENLNTGVMVTSVTDTLIHSDCSNNGIVEKYCYDNDPALCAIYGGLYDWDEMMQYAGTAGAQGICPADWHIPTMDEYTAMVYYLGGGAAGGGKLKETGFAHWDQPNEGATNLSGFTALGAAYRDYDGDFSDLKLDTFFWTSSEYSATEAWYPFLANFSESVYKYASYKTFGFSVRCLKD